MTRTLDREHVRRLVRQELARRMVAPPSHPALDDIHRGPECADELGQPVRTPCLIEPDRPCYQSGYCKKLGF